MDCYRRDPPEDNRQWSLVFCAPASLLIHMRDDTPWAVCTLPGTDMSHFHAAEPAMYCCSDTPRSHMGISTWLVLLVAVAVHFIGVRPLTADDAARPNIIFVLADDLGWGDLGCYGGRLVKTPNLDRLAQQGTLFTQFYVNASVCSPSRCAFFTGQYPARHRIHGHFAQQAQNRARGMSDWLDPDVPTLAKLLQQAGYATAHIGKWHLGQRAAGPDITEYGFDQVGDGTENASPVNRRAPYYRARSTELFVNESLEFIEEHRNEPFFVQLWTLIPHATLKPTDEQLEPFRQLTTGSIDYPSAQTVYAATIADLDHQIGRLLDGLDDLELAENTIVIFSSDNGPEDIAVLNASHSGVGSAGPFRGRKRSLYEGGVRMPFLVRWPGQVPGGRVDDTSVVAAVDMLPTLCGLAGADIPEGHELDGEDVADILAGASRPRHNPLMWEWRFGIAGHVWNVSPQLAIRSGDWKLYMNPDGTRVELYDMPRDPMQLQNLSSRYPDLVQRLSKELLDWQSTLPQGPTDRRAGINTYRWPVETEIPDGDDPNVDTN